MPNSDNGFDFEMKGAEVTVLNIARQQSLIEHAGWYMYPVSPFV